MPELPEVRITSRTINRVVAGNKIIGIKILAPKMIKEIPPKKFVEKISGNKILKVSNLGKFIIFFLTNNLIMLSHMRMEGRYRSEAKKFKLRKHDYLIFEFKDFNLVYSDTRLFGTFHLRRSDNFLNLPPLKNLSKEPQFINVEEIMEKTKRKSIAIKSTLLDQSIILGLGNIYANETLFYSKINPFKKTNLITSGEWQKILRHAYEIMTRATKMGGSTIKSYHSFNDKIGRFQRELLVHGRDGRPCPRCKTIILKTKINGRGTYYCPKCQK